MEITLVENGMDFILSALEYAQKDDTRNLKYAVLHLSDGVELILKEKLRRKDWKLLFQDPKKADEKAFGSGDFKSVDFKDCIERLAGDITIEPYHFFLLNKLRNMRNRIQHFQFNGNKEEVVSMLVSTWSFVLDFVHDNLADILEDQGPVIEKIKELMIANKEFVKTRLASIKGKLDEFKEYSAALIECPHCLQETLMIPGGEPVICLFCRYSAEPDEAAELWGRQFIGPDDPKDWEIDNPIHSCPECGAKTALSFDLGNMEAPNPGWVCFSCGTTWGDSELCICSNCGNLNPCSDENGGICDDCWREMVEHD